MKKVCLIIMSMLFTLTMKSQGLINVFNQFNNAIENANKLSMNALNYYGDLVNESDVTSTNWEFKEQITHNKSLLEQNNSLRTQYQNLLQKEMQITSRTDMYLSELSNKVFN